MLRRFCHTIDPPPGKTTDLVFLILADVDDRTDFYTSRKLHSPDWVAKTLLELPCDTLWQSLALIALRRKSELLRVLQACPGASRWWEFVEWLVAQTQSEDALMIHISRWLNKEKTNRKLLAEALTRSFSLQASTDFIDYLLLWQRELVILRLQLVAWFWPVRENQSILLKLKTDLPRPKFAIQLDLDSSLGSTLCGIEIPQSEAVSSANAMYEQEGLLSA